MKMNMKTKSDKQDNKRKNNPHAPVTIKDAAACTRLSSSGYSFPRSAVSDQDLQVLTKALTVTPIVPAAPTPPSSLGSQSTSPSFRLWLESPQRIYVPKYFGLSNFGLPGKVTIPEGEEISLTFNGSIRAEQETAVQAYMSAVRDPLQMGGILSLPCGSGKTVIALHILAMIGRKAMIVVHKDFLLQQWRERIDEFLPGARIGTVKAQKIDVEDKDIIIASLQSLSMKTYPEDLFKDVGFLIIDEVHRTGTEVFSRALHKVNVKRSLGLSATVKRKDGMSKVFEWFIGRVVYAAGKRSDEVAVWMRPFCDPCPGYCEEPMAYGGKLNLSRMINNITEFRPRIEVIVDFIVEAIERDPGRRVLVLSDRKKHLRDIQANLRERLSLDNESGNKPSNITSGMYVGSMKPTELAESQGCDVILATFSFASEGFDVPGLDTLVLASPKTDIEQSVGRILRQKAADRKNIPLIFDVLDDFSVFRAQAKKRLTFYKKHRYNIVQGCKYFDLEKESPQVQDSFHQGFADEDGGEEGVGVDSNSNASACILFDMEDQ